MRIIPAYRKTKMPPSFPIKRFIYTEKAEKAPQTSVKPTFSTSIVFFRLFVFEKFDRFRPISSVISVFVASLWVFRQNSTRNLRRFHSFFAVWFISIFINNVYLFCFIFHDPAEVFYFLILGKTFGIFSIVRITQTKLHSPITLFAWYNSFY